jgi:YgiT-type zinc finger domain-containing protein
MLKIKICPSCGSEKIRKVRRKWSGEHRGQEYFVPALEFFECPTCGERIYDRDAMRTIEAHSPAFTLHRARRKSA